MQHLRAIWLLLILAGLATCSFDPGLQSCPPGADCSRCANDVIDGLETDVDCGGGACASCSAGARCVEGHDCASQICLQNVCTEAPLGCGDGVPGGSETCDDGNTLSGDGCDANCTITACGNGITTNGEACDDGDLVSGDGCDNNCTASTCGNGVTAGAEVCDDGNANNGDGCDENCTVSACGNGVRTADEVCDDGNALSGDGCDTNCTISACGNGITAPNEACDDGNTQNGDGCDANCTVSGCGNGQRSDTEECDDGNLISADGCDANCRLTSCGNGIPTGQEACDDGNLTSDDGCDANCTPTGCGNGVQTSGESCDDGNQTNGDNCDNNCTPTGCGNGIETNGETCDDGNLVSGDGCDANCSPTGCGNGVQTSGEACDDGNTNGNDGVCVGGPNEEQLCTNSSQCGTVAEVISLLSAESFALDANDLDETRSIQMRTGAARMLVVAVSVEGDNAAPTAMYNGIPMQRAVGVIADGGASRDAEVVMYYLPNASLPTGGSSYPLRVTLTANAGGGTVHALQLANVAQAAPEATATQAIATATISLSTPITTLSNGAWLIDAVTTGNAQAFATIMPQVERTDQIANSSSAATSTETRAMAGARNLTWTCQNCNRIAHAIVALAPAQRPAGACVGCDATCNLYP